MKYILQVFTGSWHSKKAGARDIMRRIDAIRARIEVEQVIIGWAIDPPMYREIGAFLRERGIGMLLWLPVFSEVSAVAEPDEALDLFGNAVVTPIRQPDEDFLFGCPSSRRNIRIAEDIYERHFADCCFDGVFLDKIRTQSFVSGVSGVLSCGCERCRRAFLKRGVDIDAVRALYEEKGSAFFDMASFPMNGQFALKDAVATRFFEAKEAVVAEAVSDLCGYFKEQDLIVGLDLFAPVVSRFVGQSYPLLAKCADFIKPMLYRMTNAPAGIGYEYALFEKNAPPIRARESLSMDRAFLETQLDAMEGVACACYPGIEINYREDIARTNPDYITKSLAAIRDHGFEGAALCWNVMLAPDAHIEAIAGMERGFGAERA